MVLLLHWRAIFPVRVKPTRTRLDLNPNLITLLTLNHITHLNDEAFPLDSDFWLHGMKTAKLPDESSGTATRQLPKTGSPRPNCKTHHRCSTLWTL